MALADGLLAYVEFEDAADIGAATEGVDFTDNNTVGQAAGKVGFAASFDSTQTEYLSRPEALVTGAGDRSLFAWVKPSGVEAESAVFDMGLDNPGERFTLRRNAGNLRIEINGAGYTSSLALPDGSWSFVGVTLGGTTLGDCTLWLNASQEATTGTATINTGADNTAIGIQTARIALGDRNWDGEIDQAGIWNRELTDAEVAELYNSGDGLAGSAFLAAEVAGSLRLSTRLNSRLSLRL